ncbi:retrovirus-related Pol polyprotein from transposon TNT 1-94 [Trichonephila clavipes]|uniref:Retrovirus-related Pol polyprotein from transposon TNT 1-94 n=1 Tax=Trichonephila clavipes TaxID=2585209 RepID=A0A8X7BE77_TRICX|nr:retrovirus-related Pol polyprotein from transposon TNT 1-94 [Trichonephila clavipes]
MSLATEDKSCPVEGIGTLRFRVKYKGSFHEITLTDVLFNPKLRRNLLSGSRLESKGAHFVGTKVSKTSTETPSTSEKPDVSSDNHSLIPCTEVKWIRNIGRKVTGSNVYYSIEGEATRLKSFNEIERYCKRHNIKYDPSLFNFRKDNTESQGFSDLSEQQEALMVEVTIPNCYKQAIRSRDASKWHDAMDKEINVMMERKVWDLVDHPDNIKILENRWVYTIKYDENNKIVRYKARLVARGNTQLRDSDFATNRDDRVSMGGFITFIDETPISWRTFKQKSVSLSTMEAEYVSLTEAAKEFIWLKNVIDNKSLNLELSENKRYYYKKLQVLPKLEKKNITDLDAQEKRNEEKVIDDFISIMDSLIKEFSARFSQFKELSETFKFIMYPDVISFDKLNLSQFDWLEIEELEMQLIDFQSSSI